MSSNALNTLFSALKLEANVFHNGQYCGVWAIDTSGSKLMTFHVVTRGECAVDVEGECYDLAEGDAIFMPLDAEHRLSPREGTGGPVNQAPSLSMTEDIDNATGLVCGNIIHDHPVFNRLLAQLPNVIIVRKVEGTVASDIITLILDESKKSGQSTNFLLNRLADALFYVLVRENINTSRGVFVAMSHPKLSKSIELIHNEFDQRLNVELLASRAGMSRSAFSSLFKELVEMSPAEYITQWRMTQAYRWLADNAMSTYEAAIKCGYESEASFSKAFKRVIGSGPGEIRQLNR